MPKPVPKKGKPTESVTRGSSVSIAEAKARFSELVSRAAAGETVSITRRGQPVGTLSGAVQPRKRIDIEMLRRVTEGMKMQDVDAGTFMRQMRDDERY